MTVLFWWFSLRTFTFGLALLSVFGVTWSSSWHPKERLDLTHITLSSCVPGRVTTAGSFGLGRVQLGLALLRLAFPSVQNFNEWQLHSQCSSVATMMMVFEQIKKIKNHQQSCSLMSSDTDWLMEEKEHKYSSCQNYYPLVTTDALSVQ